MREGASNELATPKREGTGFGVRPRDPAHGQGGGEEKQQLFFGFPGIIRSRKGFVIFRGDSQVNYGGSLKAGRTLKKQGIGLKRDPDRWLQTPALSIRKPEIERK